MLDNGLAHLADVIERDLGIDIRTVPGSGAAGGLGAGAVAFLGAQFRSGIDLVLEATEFDKHLAGADLVQLYTGLVFRGPGLTGEVARAIEKVSTK